jgi:hypothetical protein
MATDTEIEARVQAARKAAFEGAELAANASASLSDFEVSEGHSQAIALSSIALSLSAMATVLLASLDEDAR